MALLHRTMQYTGHIIQGYPYTWLYYAGLYSTHGHITQGYTNHSAIQYTGPSYTGLTRFTFTYINIQNKRNFFFSTIMNVIFEEHQ